jgi:phenylalanyl-tRNA synthetase beta chain
MKISYNWLRNYLPVTLSVNEASEILTSIGLEVEDVVAYESLKGGLKGVVVGEVLTCEKHPNADKLRLTTVNIGAEQTLKIVCGAPNVEAGQKVMVATIGTTIYPTSGEALTMKKAKIRGEESEGMICAEDELGLGTSHAGIIVLPNETKIGTTAAEYFGIYNDYIIEIGLTPNRSDAFSHIGVAREMAAWLAVHKPEALPAEGFKNPIKISSNINIDTNLGDGGFSIEVINTDKCGRYTGILINNIKVEASPKWLQNNLKAIGLKPINNIVDATNYVLHETGQPLHAFDADKIAGKKIVVKTLPEDTLFTALDEKERKLSAEDLMICDAEKPMCMAGVYGGLHSGVAANTTSIFLESAWFNATSIRKTSFLHQLRTDAALHFEKGIDAANIDAVLKRAALLICEIAGGKIASKIIDANHSTFTNTEILLQHNRVNEKLGIELSAQIIETILTQLGFELTSNNNQSWLVKVPSHKTDISIEADLIEEILRLYGLDRLPIPSALQAIIPIRSGVQAIALRNKAANFLAANGFSEMMNNSLSQSKYYEQKEVLVTLLNSMNTELDVLRNNLLFGGLEAIQHNQNRQNADLKLFEFGKSYATINAGNYEEQMHLCFWMTGKFAEQNWNQTSKLNDIYSLKNQLQKLFAMLGIQKIKTEEIENASVFEYGIKYTNGKETIAESGSVHPSILKQFDIRNEVMYASINWQTIEKIVASQKIKYIELPKFPAVQRDLALLLNEEITYAQVEKIAKEQTGAMLKEVSLFDVYRDKKIGEGRKSYAISLTLQDESKTLTDDKVEKVMSKLIQQFEQQLQAEIRK